MLNPPSFARKPDGRWRTLRGFTLIELMVTVAIVAVSLALAAPGFAQVVSNYRLRSAAESVLNGLNLARAEAVRRNTPIRFALTGTKSGWTVWVDTDADGVVDAGETVIQSRSDSETSGLSAASSNAATGVAFLPTGLVDATGTWLTQITVSSATAGTDSRRINILGGGLIRMCDPAAAVANDPRRC